MIDILLVLIVIFMAITSATPRGLRALVPQPAPTEPATTPRAGDIVISVYADGVRLNHEPVDISNLKERLSRSHRHRQ